MTEPHIYKGLAGVTADTTAISKVNPQSNSLLYRGYPVQELAASVSFEDVAWLLWHGELPSESEAHQFRLQGRSSRALTKDVKAAIDLLPLSCHPMDVGRTAVSVIGASHPKAEDNSPKLNWKRRPSCWRHFPPSSHMTSGAAADLTR